MDDALLIHGGAVGDFVMSLRIVAALRETGAGKVTVLGKPEIATIAVPGGGVDAVIDINQGGYHSLFSAEPPIPAPVLEILRRFDLAVDMLGGPRGVVTTKLREAGIPKVIAFDPRPRSDWTGHISDQWLADLQAAGIHAVPGPPLIRLSEERRDQARHRLLATTNSANLGLAVLHPGSGSRQKCWPPTHFAGLAMILQTRGWGVTFLLGPVETERFTASETASLRGAAPMIVGCSLPDAADLIAAANLFVGNDSGMSHLAAAIGTPTVAIFGPTNPKVWGPMARHAVIIGPGPLGAWPWIEEVADAVPKGTWSG